MASVQHQMENMNLSSQQQFNNSRIYNNKFQQSPQSGAQQNAANKIVTGLLFINLINFNKKQNK